MRGEEMEQRTLLSFADGNGPVVTAITETPGSKQLVITFDGPLNPGTAEESRTIRSRRPWRTQS